MNETYIIQTWHIFAFIIAFLFGLYVGLQIAHILITGLKKDFKKENDCINSYGTNDP